MSHSLKFSPKCLHKNVHWAGVVLNYVQINAFSTKTSSLESWYDDKISPFIQQQHWCLWRTTIYKYGVPNSVSSSFTNFQPQKACAIINIQSKWRCFRLVPVILDHRERHTRTCVCLLYNWFTLSIVHHTGGCTLNRYQCPHFLKKFIDGTANTHVMWSQDRVHFTQCKNFLNKYQMSICV